MKAGWLRLRLALRRADPVALGACLLASGALASLAWVLPARERLEGERAAARQMAKLPPRPAAAPPAADAAQANLALFHAALGKPQGVEREIRTLFALAARNGLILHQGEYKRAVDRAGGFATYQVNLPVKGSYAQVWRFALEALRAMPFASLDDISFRREHVGAEGVEARLRLTLYLAAGPGGTSASPAGSGARK